MKKRLLSIFLTLVMVLSIAPLGVAAQGYEYIILNGGQWSLITNGDTAEVQSVCKVQESNVAGLMQTLPVSGKFSIPSYISGYKIVAINSAIATQLT